MPRLAAYLLTALALLAAPAAQAQQPADTESEECAAEKNIDTSGLMAEASTGASAAPADSADAAEDLTDAERRVRKTIQQDGVHVVHFWAPWCPNSKSELENGWYEVIDNHGDVSFTFVTVRNDGESGREMLEKYAVASRVTELTMPGARSDNEFSFLDLPVTWIPTTWIFHDNGTLAFAMNYGEMDMNTLDHLIDLTKQDW